MKAILAAVLACSLSVPAFAGRLKEIYIQHEEVLFEYLFGTPTYDGSAIQNTRFVTASEGADVALASDVMIYNYETKKYQQVTCTTQFKKVSERNFEVSKVHCD